MIDAKKLVGLALRLGASDAEVYASSGKVVTVETEHGELGHAEESLSEGAGIRVIVNGAEGFSSSNDPGKFEDGVKAAIVCAKSRPRDPSLKGLPAKVRSYPEVAGIYDRRVEDLGLDECVDLAAVMIAAAKEDKGAMVPAAKFSSVVTDVAIENSNGVSIEERESVVMGFVDVIIKEGDSVSTAFDYDVSRSVLHNIKSVGHSASKLARSSLGSVQIDEQTCDVLLGPFAFGDLLESTLLFSVSAENVQKGRSGLAGRIGKKIAADGLTIVDDGALPGGMGSSRSDDEGVASRKTTIIGDGLLESFLYDTYTAGKEDRESTGNAVRASYSAPPRVGPRNVRFEFPRCDVLHETAKGIYVNSVIGAHTANPISGDFSVECRNSFGIKDGELAKPIKSLMLSGNIFDVLRNIDALGEDDRSVGSVISPTVRVKSMRVTPGA